MLLEDAVMAAQILAGVPPLMEEWVPPSPVSLATSHHLHEIPSDRPPTFLLPTLSSRRRRLLRPGSFF